MAMRIASVLLVGCCASIALAQRPSIPPQAINAPELRVEIVDAGDYLELPDDLELGQVASVAVDANGHLFVLHRGEPPLLEFTERGEYVRGFGEGLFTRAHGLTLAEDGGFWVTDVSAHVVMRLDRNGERLLLLGTPGEAGVWDEAAGVRLFDQPNDVAIGPDGSVYVSQGHSRGEPRMLKFDADGNFVSIWGGRGTHPWEFAVPHSIVIDDAGNLLVADRENRRIQIYDLDGEFQRGWVYRGMACSLTLGPDGYVYMTTGFDGQIVRLDREGHVLGVTGRPGEGPNEYGEAHDLAVSPDGLIFIADVVNRRLEILRLLD